MKIIKCGGAVLKDKNDRLTLYNDIKKIDDKVILIVSAFTDCPYSTKALSELLTQNYTYEMKQQLITLGEIISSIRVCNEMKNELIDASVIFKEQIGIHVKTSDKMDSIECVDIKEIINQIESHKVIVIPGFIGINQNNLLVSLNENGSDLTAVIIAKELNIKEVYLYKNVLGLSSIEPSISSNYKLYKSISYSLMNQLTSHGCNLIQQQALQYAKENDIKIIVNYYLNNNYKTIIEKIGKEKVIVFQIYNENIYIEGYNNKQLIENLLESNNIKFEYILPCNSYLKIVTNGNQNEIINFLHNRYIKGDL